MYNPVTPVILSFKYAVLGVGNIPIQHMVISAVVSFIVFFVGLILFNQIEKTFMDTV